ncbi:MerR family transcriptional regulator [Duganella sp. P38]|uniref:MerR family transcriptional regulator n=1 Tax=Duganella sp. P38 TaxID=3423949 RepID=UPI003D7C0E22
MSNSFTIGQLAVAADMPAATIRYYEKIALLAAPTRTPGNYRQYDDNDLARLIFVKRARDIGFTIDQIRSLLLFSDQRDADCCEVMAMTGEHLRTVEQKIAELTALKNILSELLTSCQGGRVAECRIIDALHPQR